MRPALVAALATALLAALPAPAAGRRDDPAARLSRVRREIARLEAERDRLARREKGVLGTLERLAAEARLLDARVEELDLRARQERAELACLQEERERLAERLADERARLAETVRLLGRLGPVGRLRLVLEARDADRLAAGLRFVHELTARQREIVAGIRADEVALRKTEEQVRARQERLEALAAEARAARRKLARTIASRKRLLARVRAERETREQALAELREAADELARAIRAGGAAEMPKLDVRRFRGLLPMPVDRGRVTVLFGDRRDPRFGTRIPHPGWDVDAPFGEPVRAIFDGTVVYADWLRGYGLVLVLDHGHGVHSVYAHLSMILAPRGTRVGQGDEIGRVGDTGSLKGPYLYLEVREDGRPVDPARWIRRDAPVP